MLQALSTQISVIAALTIRALQGQMHRYNYGFAWAFVQPILYIVLLRLMHSLYGGFRPPDMPPMTFLVIGVIPHFIYIYPMQETYKAMWGEDALLTLPRVTQFDICVAG